MQSSEFIFDILIWIWINWRQMMYKKLRERKKTLRCLIRGSHNGDYEEDSFLECNAV
jgi:hypothetical protein